MWRRRRQDRPGVAPGDRCRAVGPRRACVRSFVAAVGRAAGPCAGQSQSRHSSLHGGCPQPVGAVRLQAEAGGVRRKVDPSRSDHGPAVCLHSPRRGVPGSATEVRQTWRIGRRTVRSTSLARESGRRHFDHQVVQDGPVQPRPRPDLLQYWLCSARSAVARFVGHVWPRGRDRRPAGVRRDVDRDGNLRRGGELVQRFPAERLLGRPPEKPGRSNSQREQPDGGHSRSPEGLDRSDQPAEPRQTRHDWRPRNRHPHQRLRNGTPAADLGSGTDGCEVGIERDARTIRLRSRKAFVRPGLPAGSPHGRTGCAVHQHLQRRLGRPLRCGGQRPQQLQGDRPGLSGPGDGPQTPGPA